MTLKNLKEALLQEAKAEADGIIAKAQTEAQAYLEGERRQHASRKKEAELQLERALATHEQERLAWATLEARRRIAEAREDAIRSQIDSLYEVLAKRKGVPYRAYLKRALARAAAAIGKNCVVHASKKDAAALKSAGAKSPKADLDDTLGGLIAESPDGKVRFNATLEARMELLHGELRKRIYEKLFGSKGGTSKGGTHGTAANAKPA